MSSLRSSLRRSSRNNSSADGAGETKAPELGSKLTPEQREEALLQFVTDVCQRQQELELEQGWSKIKEEGCDVILSILAGENLETKPFGVRGFSSLFTISYYMCSQPAGRDYSEELYQRHNEVIREYVENTVVPKIRSLHGEYLLQEFCNVWESHKMLVKWMTRLFMHMDKAYIANSSLPTLTSVGLRLFHSECYESIKDSVNHTMIQLINSERDGTEVDHKVLRSCAQMYQIMGITTTETSITTVSAALKLPPQLRYYEEDFETSLLASTAEYFQQRSAVWMEQDSTPQYLLKADVALVDEAHRVSSYLHATTGPKLRECVVNALIRRPQELLLTAHGSGALWLFDNDRIDDLARMYESCALLDENGGTAAFADREFLLQGTEPVTAGKPGNAPFAELFRQHVAQRGEGLIAARKAQIAAQAAEKKKESASDPEMVEGMIALHRRCHDLVQRTFQGDHLFQRAMVSAFTVFVNDNAGRHSNTEMISTYCDRLLKGSVKGLSETEMEARLEDCMKIFSFLTDKDLFAEIYRDQLAKRLLNSRSVSDEAERSMIGKLKMQCGAPFTSKLEGMVNDFRLGNDSREEFNEHMAAAKAAHPDIARIDFAVQVLTTGFWPSQKLREVALPSHMSKCVAAFEDWYGTKHNHRNIQWIHHLGDCEVGAKFPKGIKNYTLQVTPLQLIALLDFNDAPAEKGLEEVKEHIGMEVDVVKRILHSLSCGKYKVLKKTGNPKSISTSDRFTVNLDFKEKKRKLRIPMASLDDANIQKTVQEDRSFAIDACIVRIMKSRKTLGHVNLMQEVIHQVQATFKPAPKQIKQRIEGLIEREYLERSEADPKIYNYLA